MICISVHGEFYDTVPVPTSSAEHLHSLWTDLEGPAKIDGKAWVCQLSHTLTSNSPHFHEKKSYFL